MSTNIISSLSFMSSSGFMICFGQDSTTTKWLLPLKTNSEDLDVLGNANYELMESMFGAVNDIPMIPGTTYHLYFFGRWFITPSSVFRVGKF